jgi:tocopherol cyclase
MILDKIHALWHPECYHGWGKTKRFFEGWYYKLVSENETHALAIIPGIAMDEKGNKQAFIQVLDGKKKEAYYHRFDAEVFQPHPKKHDLKLENNRFSSNKISLNLPDLKGEIQFSNLHPWSTSLLSPGIMGPFSFVPFMECYHGILSMDHVLSGSVVFKGETLSFDNGRGYMEKDWGHSFPEGYIWMQSNLFSQKEVSVKASIAKIPWLGTSFVGHIAGVLMGDQLIEFTTYNGTQLLLCQVTQEAVLLHMENRSHRLEIKAKREEATSLAAPIAGFMDARIEESMKSEIHVLLTDKKRNKVLLNDTGTSAGIEVAGNYSLVMKG